MPRNRTVTLRRATIPMEVTVNLRNVYLILCVIGLVLPYAQFVPWVIEHGLDAPRFVSELFADRIGAFFGLDVIVSAVVLFVFIAAEHRRTKIPLVWAPVAGTLAVGVSFGLPLFLYLRERSASKTQFED